MREYNIKSFSVNDPSSNTSLKVKIIKSKDNSPRILFEVLHLEKDNMTQKYSVEYFMDIEDFDYIYECYNRNMINDDKGVSKQKGYHGKVRAIRFLCIKGKLTPGHLSISIVNGTGTPQGNGFTPRIETVTNKRMINMNFEQSIKMFKHIEREVLVNSFHNS